MTTDTRVRPATEKDYPGMVDYFLDADRQFLEGMGVDVSKLPSREQWLEIVLTSHAAPLEEKKFFYLIWELDGTSIGHCNINKIVFGKEAYMHLHMWRKDVRRSGLGEGLVRQSIPFFFRNFQLQNLYCEPYALNQAPNKTLPKVGFEFVKTYETVPGWINTHQPVNRWHLSRSKFESIRGS